MSEFTKDKLIALQMNLGLGHYGEIILTTQKRIDDNIEPIAKDIFNKAYAEEIPCRWNEYPTLKQQRDDLLEACKKITKVSRQVSSMAGKDWLEGQLLLIDETDKFVAAIAKCEA